MKSTWYPKWCLGASKLGCSFFPVNLPSIWLQKWLHLGTLLAPCATLLGYDFLTDFQVPQMWAKWCPKGTHHGVIVGSHVCYLFWKGQTSIFDNASIENTTLSLPEGSKNEIKIGVKMCTQNRRQNTRKMCPQWPPMGTLCVSFWLPKRYPKQTLKQN